MSIKEARINHILSQSFEIDGRTWTRKEWLDYQHDNGREIVEATIPKYKFDRSKYNSLHGKEQEEYEARANIVVPAYLLDGVVLNKTELDYYRSIGGTTRPVVYSEVTYQTLMKDPSIKAIVHQLQKIDNEDEWWATAKSLNDICSQQDIDLIDRANDWNIND